MDKLKKISLNLLILFFAVSLLHADGAGPEWEKLSREVAALYSAGEYRQAIAVAEKALQMAEENAGPDHFL